VGTGIGAPTTANKGATTTVASKGGATPATPATSKGATPATTATPTASKAGATSEARGQTNVGGILPMVMHGADSKVEVKNLDNGVTLTITSADPAMAMRLKKMAEAMRLMNEAMRP
jgi:hypothetical protein